MHACVRLLFIFDLSSQSTWTRASARVRNTPARIVGVRADSSTPACRLCVGWLLTGNDGIGHGTGGDNRGSGGKKEALGSGRSGVVQMRHGGATQRALSPPALVETGVSLLSSYRHREQRGRRAHIHRHTRAGTHATHEHSHRHTDTRHIRTHAHRHTHAHSHCRTCVIAVRESRPREDKSVGDGVCGCLLRCVRGRGALAGRHAEAGLQCLSACAFVRACVPVHVTCVSPGVCSCIRTCTMRSVEYLWCVDVYMFAGFSVAAEPGSHRRYGRARPLGPRQRRRRRRRKQQRQEGEGEAEERARCGGTGYLSVEPRELYFW